MRAKRWVLAAAVLVMLLAWSSAAGAQSIEPPAGAVACSGCHPAGTGVDTPVARLVGRNADEIVAAMRHFRDGERKSTVMGRIAKGFSDAEIQAIAAWYAAQK
jgi:cytochrome c553